MTTTEKAGIVTHPEYAANFKYWRLIKDAASISGVKDNDLKSGVTGYKYAPFVGEPTDQDSQDSYFNYINRAVYYGFTGQTVAGLTGLAFLNGASIENADTKSEYIETDVDGSGVGIEQQSQSVLNDVVKYYRGGLYVDYPSVDSAKSAKQEKDENIRASIISYDAFQIKNWQTKRVNGRTVLSLVSLCEIVDKIADDGITVGQVEQERRLFLDDKGFLVVEIYVDGEEKPSNSYKPKAANKRLSEIPFYPIGGINNDIRVDEPEMYSIATINIGHYINSADLENKSYYVGQPQPVATGLTGPWVEKYLKGFNVGSRTLMPLPAGGDFKFAEVGANDFIQGLMAQKVEMIIALGGKLIVNSVNFNTVLQSVSANAAESSQIQTIVTNVEAAYSLALEMLARFNGSTTAPVFTINADLAGLAADPAMLKTLVESWMSGLVSKTVPMSYMKKVGATEQTLEDLLEGAEEEHGVNGENRGVNLDAEEVGAAE